MAQPIIAIIPGAFCNPATYSEVAKFLRQTGYIVVVPALTTAGDLTSQTPESPSWKAMALKEVWDDVKMIHDVLSPYFEQGKEAVLVGHSYGSVPAMLNLQDHTLEARNVKGLTGGIVGFLNVAGFAHPARGKNVMGTEDEIPIMPYHTLEEGILHLQDTAKPLFFSDLSSEARNDAWAMTFKHQSRKSLLYLPNFIEADVTIPKAYVKCENDEVLAPAFQDSFIAAGRFEKVFVLPSGHFPSLSMSEKLAGIIGNFAKSLRDS